MADALFIDNVDTEWCFRATSKGYSLFGSNKAKLFHELGNRTITVAKRRYPVHNATRLYYIIRNPILLARMPHVPKKWVFQEILHIPLKLAIFSFFVADRSANARSILVGLWHGLIGRTGPMVIR
jgi:rhamnosyltransferase